MFPGFIAIMMKPKKQFVQRVWTENIILLMSFFLQTIREIVLAFALNAAESWVKHESTNGQVNRKKSV